MVYLQNWRVQLTGGDLLCFSRPQNGPKTYTSLCVGQNLTQSKQGGLLFFADFRSIKNICQNKCITGQIDKKKKKAFGYSGNLPHCPAKGKTSSRKCSNYQKKRHFICDFMTNRSRYTSLLTAFCLHCAVEEKALSYFSNQSDESELEKPHLVIKIIGNAFGYTAKLMLRKHRQRYQICEPFGSFFLFFYRQLERQDSITLNIQHSPPKFK